jgi:hypothetical protein
MTLEAYLSRRNSRTLAIRIRFGALARRLPFGFSDPLLKLIWPSRLRHMRFLPVGITLQPLPDGRWTINTGTHLLTTLPLAHIIEPLAKPVILVATGPSSREYSWGELRQGTRFLIALNGAPTLLKEFGLKPDMMVVTDREFALTGAHHFQNAPDTPLVIEFLAAAALASTNPELLTGRPVAIIERVNCWYGLPRVSPKKLADMNWQSNLPWYFKNDARLKSRAGWSYRPECGLFSGRTVAFAALQIAVRLGAKDIEIVGMDLTSGSRAYAEINDTRPSQLETHYENYIYPSFKLLKQALASSGIKIKNLSTRCRLPADFFDIL